MKEERKRIWKKCFQSQQGFALFCMFIGGLGLLGFGIVQLNPEAKHLSQLFAGPIDLGALACTVLTLLVLGVLLLWTLVSCSVKAIQLLCKCEECAARYQISLSDAVTAFIELDFEKAWPKITKCSESVPKNYTNLSQEEFQEWYQKLPESSR